MTLMSVARECASAMARLPASHTLMDFVHIHDRRGYVYVSFIMNTSITIAFYWLAMFYVALKHELGEVQRRCLLREGRLRALTPSSDVHVTQRRFLLCPSSFVSKLCCSSHSGSRL